MTSENIYIAIKKKGEKKGFEPKLIDRVCITSRAEQR